MNLETAVSGIRQSFTQMNQAYRSKVFDEIAIIGNENGALKLHYYEGPRETAFLKDFAGKTELLRQELATERNGHGGEFGFTREGEGDSFDAYICLGPGVYLFCNNTEKSMHEVTQDSRWLEAQGKFLAASQRFAGDPLVVE